MSEFQAKQYKCIKKLKTRLYGAKNGKIWGDIMLKKAKRIFLNVLETKIMWKFYLKVLKKPVEQSLKKWGDI